MIETTRHADGIYEGSTRKVLSECSKCVVCSTDLVWHQKKFCSDKCRFSQVQELKPCPDCGKLCKGNNGLGLHRRLVHKVELHKEMRKCPNPKCTEHFEFDPARPRKFCGKDCYSESMLGRTPTNKGKKMVDLMGDRRFEEMLVDRVEEHVVTTAKDPYHRGYYFSVKSGCKLKFDSGYELFHYVRLERDDQVVKYGRCGFVIPYFFEGVAYRYHPDLLVSYKDGSFGMVEIKREDKFKDPKTVAKGNAGRRYCEENHLTYEVMGETHLKLTKEDLKKIEFFTEEKRAKFLKRYKLEMLDAIS